MVELKARERGKDDAPTVDDAAGPALAPLQLVAMALCQCEPVAHFLEALPGDRHCPRGAVPRRHALRGLPPLDELELKGALGEQLADLADGRHPLVGGHGRPLPCQARVRERQQRLRKGARVAGTAELAQGHDERTVVARDARRRVRRRGGRGWGDDGHGGCGECLRP